MPIFKNPNIFAFSRMIANCFNSSKEKNWTFTSDDEISKHEVKQNFNTKTAQIDQPLLS